MNSLTQLESMLIGTDTEVKNLAMKQDATILVFSDSHGQKHLVHQIIHNFGKRCDSLVFCGDGISDLLSALDDAWNQPSYAVCIPPVVAFVQGNGDSNRYPVEFYPHGEKNDDKIYHEISIPKRIIFSVAGHKLFVVHGHYEGIYYSTDTLLDEIKQANAQIALYGHSHISKEEKRQSNYLLNPGSCFRPRGGQPPSIATLTIHMDSNIFETVFYKITIKSEGLTYTPFQPASVSLW
jgi:uncharacterized protein